MKDKKRLSKREKLSLLIRSDAQKQFVRIGDAERVFEISRSRASQLLSKWTEQGWLQRVSHGVYASVPLEFGEISSEAQILDDPWLMMPELFGSNYYIGGLSAASHWGLTEQTFKKTFVFTTKLVRSKSLIIQGHEFIIKTIVQNKMFGKDVLWRKESKIQISNIYKTLIDMLDDPLVGGGIQHVCDCLEEFLTERPSRLLRSKHPLRSVRSVRPGRPYRRRFILNEENAREDRKRHLKNLIQASKKLNKGSVFKRLGFLADHLKDRIDNDSHKYLVKYCKNNLKKGYSNLDPSLKDDQLLITKWNLWIPKKFLKSIYDY